MTSSQTDAGPAASRSVTLFLGGDVMLGRGIDQILTHPGDPVLHEPTVDTALDYVRLAEAANGPIPRPVAPSYVWGDALAELAAAGPARSQPVAGSFRTHRRRNRATRRSVPTGRKPADRLEVIGGAPAGPDRS